MILETARLGLRRFGAGDAAVLAAYRSVPEVARYQGWEAPVRLGTAVRLVRDWAAAAPEEPGWFQYAVELRADRTLVGDIGVKLDESLRLAEIGYTFAPEHQGRGYATEAVGALLRDLFDRRGVHRVSAVCDRRNDRSAALLRRLGFTEEGMLRQAAFYHGEWVDELMFGLLRSDSRP